MIALDASKFKVLLAHKMALFAIALSPFLLNAQLREEYLGVDEEVYSDEIADSSSLESQNSNKGPQDSFCRSPYHRMHISARHNENEGIGYKDGYTTLEAFGIYDGWSSHFMPFLDLRGHVFNNGKLAGNVGIGERTLISSINHTFGSYLYYDVRKLSHGLTVNQLSPGLELVGRRMEYRINGYFPLGKDKTHKYGYKFDEFEGNNILLKSKQWRALRGGDAEIGVHVTQSTKYDLYAAVGPYYIHAPKAHSWGGRTRLVGRYKEHVSLEVAYSYDHLFRNIVQGSVAVTLPFGRKLKRTGAGCPQGNDLLLSRASFAPSRFEIPVVKRVRRKEKAINPATAKPWTVWFVNNTSHSEGTFESPFPMLFVAQNVSAPNDMIYVFAGDGTSRGLSMGITLKDGQSFFGSGTQQHFKTTHGKMTIPRFTKSMPMIAGGVTTGNSNVISGFNVTSGTVGNSVATNLVNLKVINNIIANGILFQGSGKVDISNNSIFGFTGSGLDIAGIGILAAPGGLITGQVSNNSMNLLLISQVAGIVLDNVVPTNPGRFDFSIINNVIQQYENGIAASTAGTNSIIRITDNTIVNTINMFGSSGIVFLNDTPGLTGQNGHTIITNNTLNWAALQPNPAILMVDIVSGPYQEKIIIQNNKINLIGNPRGEGIGLATFNTFCVTMDNNTVIGASSAQPAFAFATVIGGSINFDSFENNTGEFITTAGAINFLPVGTCSN